MRLRQSLWCLAAAFVVAAGAGSAAAQTYYWTDQSPRYYQSPSRDFFSFPFLGGERYRQPPADSTKAPPPRKLETPPTSTVVVIGDSMADWLGYGLDENYADRPEIGVVREIRASAGLIRYDAKNETLSWPQVVKDALANDKPNAIVIMLGLNDRTALRDVAPPPPAPQQNATEQTKTPAGEKPAAEKPGVEKAGVEKAGADKAAAEKAGAEKAAAEKAAAEKLRAAADSESPSGQSILASEPQHPVPGGVYEFHTDQWAELYVKRIDEMIAAAKSRGVPVLWVGLPALRGPKSTSEMAYLDELYRERAERAGIYYVDIWDGFVDDQGRYAVEGPDFEGQIRRLRTADGVHFTKAGAVKLASYVDQELRRVMSTHPVAVALPEATAAPVKPGAPRPDVGPVLPLTSDDTAAASGGLLGGGGHPATLSSDPLAAKVMSRGDPIAAVAGRADDFSWPRPATDPNLAVRPQPVALSPAEQKAAGKDETKKPGESKKDDKKKPAADAAPEKSRRTPSAQLDRAPRPPGLVGGGF